MDATECQERVGPVIDVVIPTIGRASLRRALRSVDQQEVGRKIVVLDDPSQLRETEHVAAEHGAELVVTAGRVGGGAARQLGLDLVSAPLVAFLDDDDEWLPNRGESIARATSLGRDGRDALVLSRFLFELPDGSQRLIPKELPRESSSQTVTGYMVRRDRLRFGQNAVQTSALAMTSALARRVRWAADLPKHQDWDFVARASRDPNADLILVSEPTVVVAKGSEASVSRIRDWKASMVWYERHRQYLGYRCASDFLAVHVLRAALQQRSVTGLRTYFSQLRLAPHVAAMVVAASGVVRERKQ